MYLVRTINTNTHNTVVLSIHELIRTSHRIKKDYSKKFSVQSTYTADGDQKIFQKEGE